MSRAGVKLGFDFQIAGEPSVESAVSAKLDASDKIKKNKKIAFAVQLKFFMIDTLW
jgi:hypothetical protein